jgi:hypothetical protein
LYPIGRDVAPRRPNQPVILISFSFSFSLSQSERLREEGEDENDYEKENENDSRPADGSLSESILLVVGVKFLANLPLVKVRGRHGVASLPPDYRAVGISWY